MNPGPAKLDRCSIERANHCAREQIAHTLRLAERYQDFHRTNRLYAAECVVCWGSGRVGGCASTSRPCAVCGITLHFGSTNIDVMCAACAAANGLCKHCGADLDLKARRKPRPFESRQETP